MHVHGRVCSASALARLTNPAASRDGPAARSGRLAMLVRGRVCGSREGRETSLRFFYRGESG